jgi:hypothetical protein
LKGNLKNGKRCSSAAALPQNEWILDDPGIRVQQLYNIFHTQPGRGYLMISVA